MIAALVDVLRESAIGTRCAAARQRVEFVSIGAGERNTAYARLLCQLHVLIAAIFVSAESST